MEASIYRSMGEERGLLGPEGPSIKVRGAEVLKELRLVARRI